MHARPLFILRDKNYISVIHAGFCVNGNTASLLVKYEDSVNDFLFQGTKVNIKVTVTIYRKSVISLVTSFLDRF